MTSIKFVVKLKRRGALAPQYVHRMEGGLIRMTSNRKLALVMGKLSAEDAIESMRSSQCSPELVMMTVTS